MRICQVITCDLVEQGGPRRHVFHLADSLRRMGDEVWIVGPSRGGDLGPNVRGFGGILHFFHAGSDNRLGILTPPWEVRRFFAEHPFDVVHVHEPCVPMLAYWVLPFTRRAAHVCTFHAYDEHSEWIFDAFRRLVGALVLPHYERAIAVSQPAARYAGLTWRRPLTVIPNGISTRLYRPEPESAMAAAGGALRLLFVGRWRDPRKGLRHLLDALPLVRARGVDVALDVIGEGTGCEIPETPGVTFHGIVESEEELAAFYRRADVFVSPATGQESFGVVLIEAMASGCPVICSDIDGYREVARPEGALLVPPRDAERLADAIATLAADPALRRRMGAANRKLAEPYDFDHLALRIRREYEAALAG